MIFLHILTINYFQSEFVLQIQATNVIKSLSILRINIESSIENCILKVFKM